MEQNVSEVQVAEGQNGAPGGAQRSGSAGERTSSEMSELSAYLAGSEGYGACEDEETGQPEEQAAGRDFEGEVAELAREFPEAVRSGRLPEEVVNAAILDGRPVADAYRVYALERQGEEETAEWNAGAARRAPVRGVSGGFAVGSQAKDAFMTGFDAE